MQVVKQRFARELLRRLRVARSSAQGSFWEATDEGHVWQRRFYDFVVWNGHKRIEKLRYMHRNPVKRGLVLEPQQWKWSSYRFYAYGEEGPVLINEKKPVVLKWRNPDEEASRSKPLVPTLAKSARVGQPRVRKLPS